jgi:hypothetical protein
MPVCVGLGSGMVTTGHGNDYRVGAIGTEAAWTGRVV